MSLTILQSKINKMQHVAACICTCCALLGIKNISTSVMLNIRSNLHMQMHYYRKAGPSGNPATR